MVLHFEISLESWATTQGEVRGSAVSPQGLRGTQGPAEDNTAMSGSVKCPPQSAGLCLSCHCGFWPQFPHPQA